MNNYEYNFYEQISIMGDKIPLSKFMCSYYGRTFIKYDEKIIQHYLIIENLLHGIFINLLKE
jgi:hypothetical protein